MFAVDKLGRKRLLIAGGTLMCICEIAVGVTLGQMFGQHGAVLSKAASSGVLAAVCLYVTGFAFSWGPIGWLYPT